MLDHAITYIPIILVILAGLAGAAAYFKSAYNSGNSKLLIDSIRTRDITIGDQEKEIAALTAAGQQKDETITELKKHNAYLQKLGRGGPELDKLTTEFTKFRKIMEKIIKANQGGKQ